MIYKNINFHYFERREGVFSISTSYIDAVFKVDSINKKWVFVSLVQSPVTQPDH